MSTLSHAKRHLAFLTTGDLSGYTTDDHLAEAALVSMGCSVAWIDWHDGAAWEGFDAVVIRSTWDYSENIEEFQSTLERIACSTRLINPLELVRWNLSKNYLTERFAGFPQIPGIRLGTDRALDPARWFDLFSADVLILKPLIGAGSSGILRVTRENEDLLIKAIQAAPRQEFLLQPFLPSITGKGELSFLFFGRRFSHAVLKKPASGDFRVQEEFGGSIAPIRQEDYPREFDLAQRVWQAILPAPVYARIDLVWLPDHSPALLEVELTEPALYFRSDPQAADHFAYAVLQNLESGVTP